MAKSRAYRWNGWRVDLGGGEIKDRPDKKKARKPKGITNEQAKYLASLQRRAGEKYSGSGLTSRQASDEIKRVLRKLDVARMGARTRRLR